MILDIINHSYGKDFVAPSVEFKGYMDGLRSFMFDKVYVNSKAKAEEGKAVDMIKFCMSIITETKINYLNRFWIWIASCRKKCAIIFRA